MISEKERVTLTGDGIGSRAYSISKSNDSVRVAFKGDWALEIEALEEVTPLKFVINGNFTLYLFLDKEYSFNIL